NPFTISLRGIGLSSAWQKRTCLTREPSALWSWLKLMLSLRAALYNLIGNDTRPKVRCPFHTVDAIGSTSCGPPAKHGKRLFIVTQTFRERSVKLNSSYRYGA